MYKYKVSIVMAVYNVEPFIREAIDSVIAQDIGFENIQLILVDDGSPDGSGTICDEYAAKYPDNILVIHKENGGVSSARNAGLDRVEGEFVNFMDPDDKLDLNTLSSVYHFFTEHGEEVDVVTIPMKFFDATTGNHVLNYIFEKGTRVIDLEEEWDNIRASASSAFFKSTCLVENRFDTRLALAEDTKLINTVMLLKCKLGVISDVTYWYRKRSSGKASAVQSQKHSKGWFIDFMKYYQQDIINYCLEHYQRVPRFIQSVLMYGIYWKIKLKNIPSDVLTEDEIQEFFFLVRTVLQYIEDEVIDAQRKLNLAQKFFAYRLKYGESLTRIVESEDICLCAQDEIRFRAAKSPLKLEFYQNRGTSCTMEGTLSIISGLMEVGKIQVKVGDIFYEACTYGARKPIICLDQEINHYLTFKVEIPLEAGKKQKLEFYCETEGLRIPLRNLQYGRYFPISGRYTKNFHATKEWILTQENETLVLCPRRTGAFVWQEFRLCCELLATKHKIARNSVASRLLLHILKPFKRKQIWLISDRASKAGDNGEAFFRYVRENHPEIDARFVINEDCPDYAAMQEVGPVVAKDSYRHKILHLLSDFIISSHGEEDIYNPFYRSYEPYRNLLAKDKYIFLQHGITKDDVSGWLCRSNKNFSGFITAAVPEYKSIVEGAYEYNEKEIWLTGLPRFDRLYRASQKWITIMPTWRKQLMGKLDKHDGSWTLALGAENSDYVRFYDGLLNDARLHTAAKKYGYQIKFLPHPNMQNHLDIFDANDHVAYLGAETEYRDIYAKSDLVVTDYSSAVFDFAYLRKPVVYAQFDADTFFSGEHSYTKGYFDYERDGFGEVEYDLDSTVERIIEYMENDCQLKDRYRERIEKFFAFNDKNNCGRVFDKIMDMEGRNSV